MDKKRSVEVWKKLTIEELQKKLVGSEFNFIELDNFMMQSGYLTVFNDGSIDDIKVDESVIFIGKDSEEYEVFIKFKIISDDLDEEAEEKFNLKVSSVEKF